MSFAVTLVLAAVAQAAPPPVYVLNSEAERFVMASTVPREDLENPAPPPAVKKGAPYRRVDLGGVGATIAASGDGDFSQTGCGGEPLPTVPFAEIPASETPYVLVPGTWKAAPEKIVTLDATQSFFQPLVAAGLAGSSVKNPKIAQGKAVKADLDGDGVDETIFSVTNIAAGSEGGALGDYTLLAVERVKDGKSQVIPLRTQIVTEDNVGAGDVVWAMPEITAIADLDGNGVMEIVSLYMGYDEFSADAWTLNDDGTATIALQAYCSV